MQKLFVKDRKASENVHYMFLFKSPRDSRSITTLSSQLFVGNSRGLTESYRDATRVPYSHLMLDLHQETDDRVRVKGNFLSDHMVVFSIW